MAITSDLDNIVKWFEEEVCPGILLKVPDDKVNDGGYSVQTAHPAALLCTFLLRTESRQMLRRPFLRYACSS